MKFQPDVQITGITQSKTHQIHSHFLGKNVKTVVYLRRGSCVLLCKQTQFIPFKLKINTHTLFSKYLHIRKEILKTTLPIGSRQEKSGPAIAIFQESGKATNMSSTLNTPTFSNRDYICPWATNQTQRLYSLSVLAAPSHTQKHV